MRLHRSMTAVILGFWILAILSGCQSTRYKLLEKVGYHKRDILVNKVEDARDAQQDAKEQFQSALEKFTAITGFEGGELEAKYNELRDELEDVESRADQVHERVADVEDVAEDLFNEWEDELDEYSSDQLRRSSERQLRRTRDRYEDLIVAMQRAETKIEPVLVVLRDQVLYLKHNLNAQAIASLENELGTIQEDVQSLIGDMNEAIEEANRFLEEMETPGDE